MALLNKPVDLLMRSIRGFSRKTLIEIKPEEGRLSANANTQIAAAPTVQRTASPIVPIKFEARPTK